MGIRMVFKQFLENKCWSSSLNRDHFHLYLSMNEPFSINIDNEVIKNSTIRKLLRVNLNITLGFDIYVTNIWNQVNKKLHAVARIHNSWTLINGDW